MKALKCMGCKAFVVVYDTASGYCGKCNIPLQEDIYLNKEFKLTKDEPFVVKIRKTKQSKTKHKKSKKKKQ
jgi:hypothetical protein